MKKIKIGMAQILVRVVNPIAILTCMESIEDAKAMLRSSNPS